jgi:hypothetical protein
MLVNKTLTNIGTTKTFARSSARNSNAIAVAINPAVNNANANRIRGYFDKLCTTRFPTGIL